MRSTCSNPHMRIVADAWRRVLVCTAIGAAPACSPGGRLVSSPEHTTESDASKGDFDAGPVTPADGSTTETSAGLSPTTATVTGQCQGAPFAAKDGALSRFYWNNGPADAPTDLRAGVSIVITQYAGACTSARDTSAPVLSLYLRSADTELSPGTFPIVDSSIAGGGGPPPQATANLFGLHPIDCGVNSLDHAATGVVTITAVDAAHVEVTFDLTMTVGGSYKGSLSLPDCQGVVPLDATDPTVRCVL
jgi:hypothetical protein